ncbi:MAG: CRISPR-associated endonuclease Cas2 [Candidatus Pacebacteria bacterium]|nr:CRISPR-associated endonuclease Cas2 [Candidatus Paceibacterota bacterium]
MNSIINLTKSEKEFLLSIKKEDEYTGREDILGEILNGVFVGLVGVTAMMNPRAFDLIKQVDGIKKTRRRKIQRAIHKIHENGLITQKGNKYYLTSKGFVILNNYKIKTLKISVSKKWDGYFRIVMFDIPEDKKYARDSLNKKLQDLGFLTLQKSVFIYPHNCQKEFEQIGDFFDVNENIVFIKTKTLSGYQKFIQLFKENGLISKNQKFK